MAVPKREEPRWLEKKAHWDNAQVNCAIFRSGNYWRVCFACRYICFDQAMVNHTSQPKMRDKQLGKERTEGAQWGTVEFL